MKPVKDGTYLARFSHISHRIPDDYEQALFYRGHWYICSDTIDSHTIKVIEWWELPLPGSGNEA